MKNCVVCQQPVGYGNIQALDDGRWLHTLGPCAAAHWAAKRAPSPLYREKAAVLAPAGKPAPSAPVAYTGIFPSVPRSVPTPTLTPATFAQQKRDEGAAPIRTALDEYSARRKRQGLPSWPGEGS